MSKNYLVQITLSAKDMASGVFGKVSSSAGGAFGRMKTLATEHGAAMNTMGNQATLAGAGIIGALGAAALKAGAFADDMEEMSQRTGLSSEKLQFLRFAADQTGTSFEGVAGAVGKLQRTMVGSPEKFAAYGIAVRDASGNMRDASALLPEIAEKIRGAGSSAERTALATDLFGKSGGALIPMMLGGSEGLAQLQAGFEQTGGAINTAKIGEFNDKLAALKQSSMTTIITLGALLIPTIQAVVEKVQTITTAVSAWTREHEWGAGVILKVIGVFGGLMLAVGIGMKAIAAYNAVMTTVRTMKEIWTVVTGAQVAAEGSLAAASATAGATAFAAALPVIGVLAAVLAAVLAIVWAYNQWKDASHEFKEEELSDIRARDTAAMRRYAEKHGTSEGYRDTEEGRRYAEMMEGADAAVTASRAARKQEGPSPDDLMAQMADLQKQQGQFAALQTTAAGMETSSVPMSSIGVPAIAAGASAPSVGYAVSAPAQPVEIALRLDRGIIAEVVRGVLQGDGWSVSVGQAY